MVCARSGQVAHLELVRVIGVVTVGLLILAGSRRVDLGIRVVRHEIGVHAGRVDLGVLIGRCLRV